jgi:hypothetical protein
MPLQQSSYLSFEPLNAAWGDLNDRVNRLNIPIALWKSPQNPALPFLQTYELWNTRYSAIFDEQGRIVRPFTVRELEDWTAKLRAAEPLVKTLEETYGVRAEDTTPSGPAKDLPTEYVTGEVPWLVRIVAGVGIGYFIFRALRPKRQSA